MSKTIVVGKTVVGAFSTSAGLVRCLRMLAPGCNPKIKKDHRPEEPVIQVERSSNETRQSIRYLKPGDFQL